MCPQLSSKSSTSSASTLSKTSPSTARPPPSGAITRLRVALALDNTGSMSSNGKMTALKSATKSLLTQLKAAATQNGDVYVSIIPFSKDVNVGSSNYNASLDRIGLISTKMKALAARTPGTNMYGESAAMVMVYGCGGNAAQYHGTAASPTAVRRTRLEVRPGTRLRPRRTERRTPCGRRSNTAPARSR